jgi:hypothetical protein
MSRLEQRCKGVQRVLEDYNIKYKRKYEDNKYLSIFNTPFEIEVSNRYICVYYHKNHRCIYLPSFEGITEFREFVKNNGTNFMKLRRSKE